MKEAEETFKNAVVVEYNSYIDGIMAVQKGVLQGFAIDQTALSYAMATEGIKNIRIIDENVGSPSSIVAGISRKTDYPALREKINAFLAQVQNDGTLDDMYQRWVIEAEDEMPQIRKPEAPQGKLIIATTGLTPPFSYYKEDTLTGMDLELIYRLADYLNAEIEVKTYDYLGITSAIEANQCDCIFSNLNATEERREVMDERITSKGFDFLGINSRIEEFGRRNMLSPKTVHNAEVIFEEFCVQTLLSKIAGAPDIRILLEYSGENDRAVMTVFHNVDPKELNNSQDELSLRLIDNASASADSGSSDDGRYLFMNTFTLKTV